MVAGGDSVICAERRPTPGIQVLLESRGAHDGRLVDLLMLVRVVGVPVAAHTALERCIGRVQRPNLGDVVFDQRVGRPPVDGYGVVAAGGADVVADTHIAAGPPAFT